MSQVEDYNNLVFNNDMISSFLPCRHSNIFKPIDIIFEQNNTASDHIMLETFRRKRGTYFTCITYCSIFLKKNKKKNILSKNEKIPELVEHVCDIFPVMLGSTLDEEICRLINPAIYPGNCSVFQSLRGMIFVDGSLSFIPYLLTNRKELGHKVKHGNELFCLYVYDLENRGHKLSIDSENKITYRNQNGEEDDTISNTTRFSVDVRHLNNRDIKHAFGKLYPHPIDIDGLENKLTLSPVNILNLMLIMAMKNPKDARNYMVHGELEKFASSKIVYKTLNFKNQKYSSGFNYRKLQPNQIIKDVESEPHPMERMVVRPIPKNVSKASIPRNTEFFFCIVEKSISHESPNRWLMLMSNVVVSDKKKMTYMLNELLDDLLKNELIKRTISIKNERIILVDGGLLTNYSINCTDDELMFFVKERNPFVEIFNTCDFIMFNLNTGLPFISIDYKNVKIWVSPLELNTYFAHIKDTLDAPMFGSSLDENTIKLAGYNDPNKFISGVNYKRNKYSNARGAQFFPYTTENVSCYLKDYNNINVKTIFSAHPQVTADSYTMTEKKKFPSVIYQRSRFDIDIQPGVNILFKDNLKHENFLYDTDCMGNKICKYICIAEIQKLKDELKYKIYPQTKLFLQKRKTANGYVYHLFRTFDDQHQLNNEFNVAISAVFDNDVKKKKLYIDVMTSTDVDFYDGFKLSDACSQKGLVCQQDLSRHKMNPDLAASVYSIIGRSPLSQLKLMKEHEIDFPENNNILFANYTFTLLKNLSFPIKSNTSIKFDLYSKKILATNNLMHTIYEKEQESLPRNERSAFMPNDNAENVGILNNLKIGFCFSDTYGNKYNAFNLLKRHHLDHELNELNAKKRKPDDNNNNNTNVLTVACIGGGDIKKKNKMISDERISIIDMMEKDSARRKTRIRKKNNAFLLNSNEKQKKEIKITTMTTKLKEKQKKQNNKKVSCFKSPPVYKKFTCPKSPIPQTPEHTSSIIYDNPTSPVYTPSYIDDDDVVDDDLYLDGDDDGGNDSSDDDDDDTNTL